MFSGQELRSAAVLLQDSAVSASSDGHLTMIFVGVIAFCFIAITLTVIALAIAFFLIAKRVAAFIHETLRKATPVISSANQIAHELEPHVRKITLNVSSITDTVKGKVDQFDDTLTEVNSRTKAQVARVDGIVSDALSTTADVAGSIQRGIRVPIREVSGIFAGFKAFFDTLYSREPVEDFEATPRAASVTPISPRPQPTGTAAALRVQETAKDL